MTPTPATGNPASESSGNPDMNKTVHLEPGELKCITTIQRPELRMAHSVFCQILLTIGAHAPETGGILLGPVGSNDITDFYFDSGAACTGATYSPDHVTLSRKMKEEWLPQAIDMKGFVHSHPGRFDRLSEGDLVYIRRLLVKNPDMSIFAAPIVIPFEFRLRPLVVLRDQPIRPVEARLMFF